MRQCKCGCGEEFDPSSPLQQYVDKKHRKRANDRRYRQSQKRTVEDAVVLPPPGDDELTLDEAVRLAEEKDIQRQNTAEAKKLLAAESRMRRYTHVLTSVLQTHDPTPLVLEPHRHDHESTIEWTVALSDWHVGHKMRLEESGGIYYQDIATTRKQVAQLWRALSLLHEIESQTYNIPKLHILGLGDFVDNDDMRPSQHRKVEDVLTSQIVQAFDLLVWFVRQALTIFPEVELDLVGGNHDRTGRNRGDAGLGELDYIDTVAWLLGAFMERVLSEDIESGRLKIRNWTTFFGYKYIAGQRVVFEHGSSMKWGGGYGGVPWYGVSQLAPKYASMLGGADVVVFGHGHQPAVIPNGDGWIFSNGSLPGTSTYVQSSFKKISRPVQWLWSTHQDLGITGWKPLYADIPELLTPGTVWDDPDHYADLASGKNSKPVDPEV